MTGRHFIAIIFASVSCLANAQEADTLVAASVLSARERPVVRASEELFIPSQVAIPMQVADVLRHFTGVQLKDYGGVGGLKTVNVRSLGSEHVGIFLDGVQIDNAQNMQVDLGRFSTEGISSVSLFNAMSSNRLQSAREYASGAAVHLEASRPEHDALKFRLRGGSSGTFNPSVKWDKLHGKNLALRTEAEFLTSNGRYRYPCFDTTLVRENGDIGALRLEGRLYGKIAGGEWDLHACGYASERGYPGPVIRRAAGFPFSAERQEDMDAFIRGGWNRDWTTRYSTALKFKFSDSYMHYATHPEKNPMAIPCDLHYRQKSAYLSLAQSYTISQPWSVDFSTDLLENALDSDVGQFVTPRRPSIWAALACRMIYDKVRASASMVCLGAWDRLKTPQAGGWSGEDGFRNAWMPSASLYWTPADWLELDIYAKKTYRLPSFNDLYYSQMGNSSLQPESASQAGADIRLERQHGAWHTLARISPYYNRVANKIVAIPTSSQFRWTMLNIGRADITGAELKLEEEYLREGLSLSLCLRYSLQRALDHSTEGSLTWGNQLPYIPLHSGSISFTASWERWALAWDTGLTGERWSRSANTSDYRIAPWSSSDLSIRRSIPLPRAGLSVGLSCNNVFNRRYEIVQGYPMPGTNAMINLELNW